MSMAGVKMQWSIVAVWCVLMLVAVVRPTQAFSLSGCGASTVNAGSAVSITSSLCDTTTYTHSGADASVFFAVEVTDTSNPVVVTMSSPSVSKQLTLPRSNLQPITGILCPSCKICSFNDGGENFMLTAGDTVQILVVASGSASSWKITAYSSPSALTPGTPVTMTVPCGTLAMFTYDFLETQGTLVVKVTTNTTDPYGVSTLLARYDGEPSVNNEEFDLRSAFRTTTIVSLSAQGPRLGRRVEVDGTLVTAGQGRYFFAFGPDIFRGGIEYSLALFAEGVDSCCTEPTTYTIEIEEQAFGESYTVPILLLPLVFGLFSILACIMDWFLAKKEEDPVERTKRIRKLMLAFADKLKKSETAPPADKDLKRFRKITGYYPEPKASRITEKEADDKVLVVEKGEFLSYDASKAKDKEQKLTLRVPAQQADKLCDANLKDYVDWNYRPHGYRSMYTRNFASIACLVGAFVILPILFFVYLQSWYNRQEINSCYYNFECKRDWIVAGIPLVGFNNLYSNLSYMLVGVYVLAHVYIFRRRRFGYGDESLVHVYAPHYKVVSAFGVVCINMGWGSSMYHVCPAAWNFQFDTLFMVFLSALIVACLLAKIVENPERFMKDSRFFQLLCFIFLVNGLGVASRGAGLIDLFWACLLVGVILSQFGVFIFAVWLDEVLFKTVRGHIKNGEYSKANQELRIYFFRLKPSRLVVVLIMAVLNIFLAVINYLPRASIPTFFLNHSVVYVVVLGGYTVYIKLRDKESVSIRSWIYLLLGVVSGVAGASLFMIGITDKLKTMDESREMNKGCVVFDFYDIHDLWHMLSALALGNVAMFIFHIDDGVTEGDIPDVKDIDVEYCDTSSATVTPYAEGGAGDAEVKAEAREDASEVKEGGADEAKGDVVLVETTGVVSDE